MGENKASSKSIGEYLNINDGDMRLNVPSFQRNYSWTKDQVIDFWDDLISLINDDAREEHFFGQIITYTENEKEIQIIDGQQRLTTSFIFMGALKSALNDFKDGAHNDDYDESNKQIGSSKIKNYADKIISKLDEKLFYTSDDDLDEKPIPKLTLQDDFNGNVAQQCLAHVMGLDNGYKSDSSISSESEKNIRDNFKTLKSKIKKYIDDDNDNEKLRKFKLLYTSFIKHFKIVIVDAKNKLSAFIIFETINTRGVSLTAADIIKSHLLSFSKDDNTFAKTWANISNKLKNDPGHMTSFIKAYVWAKYDTPTERDLFRSVSKKVCDKKSADNFLTEMNNLIDTYRMLIHFNSNKSSFINGLNNELTKYNDSEGKTNELIDVLFSLDGMGEVLHHPLVLSLKEQNLNLEHILLIMNKIRSVIVRKNIISGIANNDLTKKIASISQDIWNVSSKNSLGLDDIIKQIDSLKGSNEVIKNNFKYFSRQGGERGKQYITLAYLLFELYRYKNKGYFKEKDKVNDSANFFFKYFEQNHLKLVNIQNDDEKIDEESDDGELLANWTVIEDSILKDCNVKKDNRVLDKNLRIEALRRSDILENKNLADELANNQNICDDQFINDRQDDFADVVNNIWQ